MTPNSFEGTEIKVEYVCSVNMGWFTNNSPFILLDTIKKLKTCGFGGDIDRLDSRQDEKKCHGEALTLPKRDKHLLWIAFSLNLEEVNHVKHFLT